MNHRAAFHLIARRTPLVLSRRGARGLSGLALWFALLLAGGCASISTGSHYDEQFDFTGLQAFAWLSDEAAVIPPDADPGNSPLLHKYIKQEIRDALQDRGLRWVNDASEADFLVGYLIGSRDRVSGSRYSEIYQSRPWIPDRPGDFVTVEVADHQVFRESTLSVDIFSALTREPVWHGWGTKVITDADRAAPRKPVRAAIREILKSFPPQP